MKSEYISATESPPQDTEESAKDSDNPYATPENSRPMTLVDTDNEYFKSLRVSTSQKKHEKSDQDLEQQTNKLIEVGQSTFFDPQANQDEDKNFADEKDLRKTSIVIDSEIDYEKNSPSHATETATLLSKLLNGNNVEEHYKKELDVIEERLERDNRLSALDEN